MITGDEHPTTPIALPLLQPDARRAERVRACATASLMRRRHRSRPAPSAAAFMGRLLPPLVLAISVVCLAELMNIAVRTLAL